MEPSIPFETILSLKFRYHLGPAYRFQYNHWFNDTIGKKQTLHPVVPLKLMVPIRNKSIKLKNPTVEVPFIGSNDSILLLYPFYRYIHFITISILLLYILFIGGVPAQKKPKKT